MPILLFAIIFLWTPPHFWALALFMNSDYSKAGIPMMPVVAGRQSTRKQIFAYSLILAVVAMGMSIVRMATSDPTLARVSDRRIARDTGPATGRGSHRCRPKPHRPPPAGSVSGRR